MAAIAGGFGAAEPPPLEATPGTPPEDAAPPVPDAGAQAPLLPSVSPATTQGVVSDLTSTKLPGGWLTAMVAAPEVALDDPWAVAAAGAAFAGALGAVEVPAPPARVVKAAAASVAR